MTGQLLPPSASTIADAAAPQDKGERLQSALRELVTEVEAAEHSKEALAALEDLVIQLRTANQHLVLATVKAQTMHEEAEALNRRQNEFLAMLAHELRNPLAPIGNAAALLEKITSAHPMLGTVHGVIQRQVQHMARLLDDLLDASRVSSGKISLQKQRVALTELIERAVEVSRPLVEKRAQHLIIEPPPAQVEIDGDPVRLAQVFSNLLINASKYTQDGGTVRLSAEVRADSIAVSISDNGAGIAPEIQSTIFDLFTQGPRSLARTEGEALLSPSAVGAPGSFRILLIEDNVDANDTLRMLLELDGHAVASAVDGLTGLARARDAAFDVIVCDIGLPGIDGFEVIRQLRQAGGAMPVMVALSGYGQQEDRDRALQAGFDDYLVKPVGGEALLRTIAAAMRT
jgi:signal transduction histidine kinase